MIIAITCFLLLILFLSRRQRGPLWAFSISWLICIFPLALGLISYTYVPYAETAFGVNLLFFMLSFVIGVTAHDLRFSRNARGRLAFDENTRAQDFIRSLKSAKFCFVVAVVGISCLCIDFYLFAGAGLDDLAALRDLYVVKESTIFARLGSIATWACLYCFAFALIHQQRMSTKQFLIFILPIGGYFLVALFSAGRQAAFQIMIFTLLAFALKRAAGNDTAKTSRRNLLFAVVISVSMISYMGFIAAYRNDALISEDKVQVLSELFNFQVAPILDDLSVFGLGVRTTLIEGMVYFSSSIAFFSKFLTLDIQQHYFGAMSFPFIFRQLEAMTGIVVIDAYYQKVALMQGAGVIGVAWTTAISNHILDFGRFGAGMFLFLQGYYSAYLWRQALRTPTFQNAVIAIIMLTSAVYMPLIPGTAETNLLLLWAFCLFSKWRDSRRALRRLAQRKHHLH